MDPQLYFSHQLTKEMALQHDDATIHASKKWENLTKYRFKSKFYLVTGLLDHMGAFCNFTLTVTLKFYCVPCFFTLRIRYDQKLLGGRGRQDDRWPSAFL